MFILRASNDGGNGMWWWRRKLHLALAEVNHVNIELYILYRMYNGSHNNFFNGYMILIQNLKMLYEIKKH